MRSWIRTLRGPGVSNNAGSASIAPAPPLPRALPGRGRFQSVWLTWDSGPNGEADYTDARYWLKRAYIINTSSDATEATKIKEIDSSSLPAELFWFTATNLSERPANTGGTETAGTHSLAKGTAIYDLRAEIDSGDPPVRRWVFSQEMLKARLLVDAAATMGGVYKCKSLRARTTKLNPATSGANAHR